MKNLSTLLPVFALAIGMIVSPAQAAKKGQEAIVEADNYLSDGMRVIEYRHDEDSSRLCVAIGHGRGMIGANPVSCFDIDLGNRQFHKDRDMHAIERFVPDNDGYGRFLSIQFNPMMAANKTCVVTARNPKFIALDCN